MPQREIEELNQKIEVLRVERESITAHSVSDKGAAHYDQRALDEIDRNIAIAEKLKKSLIEGTPNQH